MKNLFPVTRRILASEKDGQKGVAVIIAIFTVMIIMWLVTEINYDTNVEYVVNANSVNKVKAYYAAKAGLDVSLLRVKLYTKIQKQLGASIPPDKRKLLDLIWNFPFAWPPMVPEEASGVDKDMIGSKVKEATMDATYYTTIADEGSKIDINDLGSPSKGLRDLTKKLLLQIFENRMQNDETWARANEGLKYGDVINNMIDWVDEDNSGTTNSDERSLYSDLPDLGDERLPPNRGFRTIDEIRMVAGMNDEIFNMLKDRITVYGMRAINPNYASAELLMSLDKTMKPEVVDKIIARRNDEKAGGFFTGDSEFWSFANGEGANVSDEAQKEIPLTFSTVMNFRIRSVGEFAGVSREIEAVVFDFNNVGTAIAQKTIDDAQKAAGQSNGQSNPSGGNTNKNTNNSKDQLPKGPPRIVYFIER